MSSQKNLLGITRGTQFGSQTNINVQYIRPKYLNLCEHTLNDIL